MMRRLPGTVCLLLAACGQGHEAGLAIRGVTVVDVTGGSLVFDQTVLIRGNRIAAVGPTDAITVAGDTELVEAHGGYLIPGLWDMHVHSLFRTPGGSNDGAIINAEWHFPLFLAHGVTGIRDMNDGTGVATLELTNSVRRRLADGILRGPPRFLAGGPSIDGDPPLPENPLVVRTAAEARAAVDVLADHGADFVKVYENVSRQAYFAIMDQARHRGLPVDGHVPFRVTPLESLRTATWNPARVLGLSDSLGSIETGKLADLVLLDANPLDDIRNTQQIRAVVADGRLYRRGDLDRLVAEIETVSQPRTSYVADPSDTATCLTDAALSERIQFAGIDQARDILRRPDQWAEQLTAFDRGARQRTLEPTSTREFLEFVSAAAAAWTGDETIYWQSLVDQLGAAMEGTNLMVPNAYLVKTTGQEEFNAACVRNMKSMPCLASEESRGSKARQNSRSAGSAIPCMAPVSSMR